MRSVDPYLFDLLPRLFPGRGDPGVVVRAGASGPTGLQWWAVPSARRARLLVPLGCPEAASMLRRHGGGARSLVRRLIGGAIRHDVAQWLPLPRVQFAAATYGDDQLDRWLTGFFRMQVSIGVLLGPPRPNRKPVLQVFGVDGAVVAFVKVGADPFTAGLVRLEAMNLELLAALGLSVIDLPDVLSATRLGGLEVLVLSPLASSQDAGRRAVVSPPLAAMAEVAASQGTRVETLQGSRFWVLAVQRADTVLDESLRIRIRQVMHRLERQRGSVELVMGSWHGDWAPWNMGVQGNKVQVWDWERFSGDVPWGLDLVHFLAQEVKVGSTAQGQQQQAFLKEVPKALHAMGPHGPNQDPTVVLVAYLVTICLRFSNLSTRAPVGAIFARVEWALDTAEAVMEPW